SNLGVIFIQKGQLEDAITIIERSLQLNPNQADALNNHGIALRGPKRYKDALVSYDRAIALKPDYAEAYSNRGNSLQELKRFDEALASYDRAITLRPDVAEAYTNRGDVLQKLERLDEALISHDRAITLKPDYAEAHFNRGITLKELNRLDEALNSYDIAITLKPDYVEAYSNRGLALQDLKRFDEALGSYDCAITLKPNCAEVYSNRGNLLQQLQRLDEALDSYEHAIVLKPEIDFVVGYALQTKMQLCLWDNLPQALNELTHKVNQGEKVAIPFAVLALLDDPALHRKTADIYVKDRYPVSHVLPKIQRYLQHAKIRIGYFSADFHNHATMHLMAEMFERHDKDHFEFFAFSFGPDTQDEWRQKVLLCFDQFIDVRFKSDREIALLARTMEIDIAIDLKGFTQDSRAGIFAERSAPIQVGYLGCPGTMAVNYMDYLVADRTLIPDDQQPYYSEKIVYLPNSYQVNISKRTVSKAILSRHEHGLPDIGFVFCCFNNNYKITPTTFAGWMRILNAVEGSVLWLFTGNNSATKNLRKEAVKLGINENRLIFAKYMPVEEHLNRIQLADLFVDTLPCNAHTTTSDALRMGLPVLTCIGHSFASRVAASLLNAVNMPELITTTQEQYEALAIELATQPEKLKTIKAKLVINIPTAPLYDTPLFTQHLESAYLTMYDRYQNGLAPEHIVVEH
ncbi:MAG: tetratricopeptide repeat protein, partial [Methylococcaceae bacterium]